MDSRTDRDGRGAAAEPQQVAHSLVYMQRATEIEFNTAQQREPPPLRPGRVPPAAPSSAAVLLLRQFSTCKSE